MTIINFESLMKTYVVLSKNCYVIKLRYFSFFVHIYTKPESDSYTKEYFVRFIAYSEEYGTCEIYMAFPICSADSMVSGTLKKIEKKLKKYIK
jgi:hypothetical protein